MGQVLHGCATTTHAVRTAIQRSKAPLKELAARHGLNHKTVAKWRKRAFVNDAPMGPKTPHSTVLSSTEEAIIVPLVAAQPLTAEPNAPVEAAHGPALKGGESLFSGRRGVGQIHDFAPYPAQSVKSIWTLPGL